MGTSFSPMGAKLPEQEEDAGATGLDAHIFTYTQSSVELCSTGHLLPGVTGSFL